MQIKWKLDYELGIEKIDVQHMRLVALINRLVDAKQSDKGRDIVETIFSGLVDYCNYHFTIEEWAMKNYGYRDYENHKSKHAAFFEKVRQLKVDYLNGNVEALTNTISYLNFWLIEHITIEDRKYVPLLREKIK